MDTKLKASRWCAAVCGGLAALALLTSGCKHHGGRTGPGKRASIQNIGSDTMVNLAQAWAETYATVANSDSIEVSGGGSGVGAAALLNGTADIANCSRKLESKELEKAKAKGMTPIEYLVGYDGLAVYVHRSNPLTQISLEELSGIYREDGKLTHWTELGVTAIPGAKSDDIIRVSRQNNSGTYSYFRETVAGKKADFKLGSLDMNGSKEVVELVGNTPGAIGYSGLGYATPAVKILKISKKKGEPGVMPNTASVHAKTYAISRPLYMYTPGEPTPRVKKYLDWILSDAGQKIVEQTGYVPLLTSK
jgi:phosphate transport system substrate-binding protein